jgi:hypothetical protein
MVRFLCAGAQKSGTTTLHEILKQHPEISLPILKETKFFIDKEKYRQGLDFYLSHFDKIRENQAPIRGEIDPDYMYHEDSVQRIHDTLGKKIKLIFILRNPADRAYSHYLMNQKRYIEDKSFREALHLEEKRLNKGEYYKLNFSYQDRGFYFRQIKRFINLFPRENMMFLLFENFIRDQEKYVSEILHFIDLEVNQFDLKYDMKSNPAFRPRFHLLNKIIYRDTILNKAAKKIIRNEEHRRLLRYRIRLFLEKLNNKKTQESELTTDIRKNMIKNYETDIEELQKFTGLDLDVWHKSLVSQ